MKRGKRARGRKRTAKPNGESGESNSVTRCLPNEVAQEILTRLPNDSIFNCKLVCKRWCDIIRGRSFANLHLNWSQQHKVSFLFLTLKNESRIYNGFYRENSEPCMVFEKITDHPKIRKPCGTSAMVGSCNGIVCLTVPKRQHMLDPVYICNPNLEEHITLPGFSISSKNKNNVKCKKTAVGQIVSGFGYDSSADEYKVVRIYYAAGQPKGQVQVYTLGSGSGWRNKEEIPYSLQRQGGIPVTLDRLINESEAFWEIFSPCRGILANGALHWFDEEWNILAFELAEEEFSLLPSPPCGSADWWNILTLHALEGRLCVADSTNEDLLVIWSFKKESSEWENRFNILCSQYKEFMDVNWPISLTLSGKLLLRSKYENLICYDPETGELQKQMDLHADISIGSSFIGCPKIEAIPHVNSFVSLKALGEKTIT